MNKYSTCFAYTLYFNVVTILYNFIVCDLGVYS